MKWTFGIRTRHKPSKHNHRIPNCTLTEERYGVGLFHAILLHQRRACICCRFLDLLQLSRSFVTALVYPTSSCGWYLYNTGKSRDSKSHCHTVIFVGTTYFAVSHIKCETTVVSKTLMKEKSHQKAGMKGGRYRHVRKLKSKFNERRLMRLPSMSGCLELKVIFWMYKTDPPYHRNQIKNELGVNNPPITAFMFLR